MDDSTLELPASSQQGSSKASVLSLAKQVEESGYVSRFMAKALTEMSFLKADKATFKTEGDALKVALRVGEREVKTFSASRSWFFPISQWLCERSSVFGPIVQLRTQAGPTQPSFDIACAVRVETDLLQFRVKKNTHLNGAEMLSLSGLSAEPLVAVIARLELADAIRDAFAALVNRQSGFLLVAAPDEASLSLSLSAVLSLSAAHNVRSVPAPVLRDALPTLAKNGLLAVPLRNDDALDAALKLRAQGIDLSSELFVGSLCQGFVRKVCPACAREAVADPGLIGMLPEGLRPAPSASYYVGRGCDKCGHSGYAGMLPVQSLLTADPRTRELLGPTGDSAKLVDEVFSRGTRPLMEDGLRKVGQGRLTLESLFNLVRTVPAGYLKYYTGARTAERIVPLAPIGGAFAGSEPIPGEETASPASLRVRAGQGKPLLLIVEDNYDQRSILEMVFKSANYEVISAADGSEAIKQLEAGNRPNLIIADLMMPHMDGREFISRLKMSEVYRNIPVLVLTVVADSDKEYDLLDLGADDYCEKTIQRKILLKRAANLIKRTQR